jgi:hypothetical protein
MSARDIMPFASVTGSHAGVSYALIDATEDYDEGDVVVVTSGDVTEAADEPDPIVSGVAAAASLDWASVKTAAGTLAAANTANVMVPYYTFNSDVEFITPNFSATDGTTLTASADEDDVGTACAIRTDGTLWGVSNAGTETNNAFVITRVLDDEMKDIGSSGGTFAWVVFKRG